MFHSLCCMQFAEVIRLLGHATVASLIATCIRRCKNSVVYFKRSAYNNNSHIMEQWAARTNIPNQSENANERCYTMLPFTPSCRNGIWTVVLPQMSHFPLPQTPDSRNLNHVGKISYLFFLEREKQIIPTAQSTYFPHWIQCVQFVPHTISLRSTHIHPLKENMNKNEKY